MFLNPPIEQNVLSYLDIADISALKQVSVHKKNELNAALQFKTKQDFLNFLLKSLLNGDVQGLKRVLISTDFQLDKEELNLVSEWSILHGNIKLKRLVDKAFHKIQEA